MKKRKLGNSGLEVSALGLGCMGLSYANQGLNPTSISSDEVFFDRINKINRISVGSADLPARGGEADMGLILLILSKKHPVMSKGNPF